MPSLSNDFGTLRTNQYQVKDLLYNNIEINTTGATSSGVGTVYPYTSSGVGTVYPYREPEYF